MGVKLKGTQSLKLGIVTGNWRYSYSRVQDFDSAVHVLLMSSSASPAGDDQAWEVLDGRKVHHPAQIKGDLSHSLEPVKI